MYRLQQLLFGEKEDILTVKHFILTNLISQPLLIESCTFYMLP